MPQSDSTTTLSPVATITLGVDGRVYWEGVTPDILEIAAVICPADDGLRPRLAMMRLQRGANDEHGSDCT